jgi:hypothetical protein
VDAGEAEAVAIHHPLDEGRGDGGRRCVHVVVVRRRSSPASRRSP